MKIAIYNNGIPFDGETLSRQPLGGSESGIIYMARELVSCGHEVTVYNNCPNTGDYAGVRYVHYHQFFSDYRAAHWDAVIAFRSFDPMLLGRLAPRMIFWTGDAYNQPSLTNFAHPAIQQNVDSIFCVSNWHRETFIREFNLPAEKVVATRNGFNPRWVVESPQKIASRAAYTSTPFRGLDILLKAFPEIHRRCAAASLDVFSSMKVYGWNSEDDRKAFGSVYDAANQAGVTWRGSVHQQTLLQELGPIGLLLYPNTFEETSCIAAIEAQASGCVVVTSARAALNETVKDGETGFCIDGEPQTENYQRRFVEIASGLMENKELFQRMSNAAKDRAFRSYTWNSIAQEWTRILEGMQVVPVTGRFVGPLALLERAHEYIRAGNRNAALRVLATVSETPFFAREVEQLKAHGGANAHGCDDQQRPNESAVGTGHLG